jgi:hypothetical protein
MQAVLDFYAAPGIDLSPRLAEVSTRQDARTRGHATVSVPIM